MATSHKITARPPRPIRGNVEIQTDEEILLAVREDAAHYPNGYANGVAHPATEGDVAALVRQVSRLLTVGAQSSLTGGATPMGDVVVDMQRFDRVLNVSEHSVTVQPGVPVGVLQATLARSNKFFPPTPTFDGAFTGGVVATHAAGAATFKYGTTRDWVTGLKVVLASGEVLDIIRGETFAHPDGYFEILTNGQPRRVPVPTYSMPNVAKCSAGYFAESNMDLIDLFIGSEGTLGIITEITLAVVTPAPHVAVVWIPLPSDQAAYELTWMLRQSAQDAWRNPDASALDVAAIEHLDARSLAIVREDGALQKNQVQLPPNTAVALLAQIELPDEHLKEPDDAYEEISKALTEGAADTPITRLCRLLDSTQLLETTELILPSDHRRQAQIAGIREAVPDGVNRRVNEAKRCKSEQIQKIAGDMIVPFERFSESLGVFRNAFESRKLDYAIWGHISDGNVHPNVIPRNLEDVTRGKAALLETGRKIIELGGCPLAEHGVGRNPVKQALLQQLYGAHGIAEMRAVKTALDPENKLAPGVLFPVDTRQTEQ